MLSTTKGISIFFATVLIFSKSNTSRDGLPIVSAYISLVFSSARANISSTLALACTNLTSIPISFKTVENRL